jgi:hypothetical protein
MLVREGRIERAGFSADVSPYVARPLSQDIEELTKRVRLGLVDEFLD